MSRVVLLVLLFFAVVMTSPFSSASSPDAVDPNSGMGVPGWQESELADLTDSPEVTKQLRERLRNLAARRQGPTVERDVVYATRGDEKLLMDVYLPEGDGPHAAVLVVHGGAWRSGSKAQLMPYARELAERGHVAFAINYRLAPDHVFPAQIEDCQEAVRFIHKNAEKYGVDPERFGAIGYSAGGHLVAMLGTQGVTLNDEHADDAATVDTTSSDGTPTNGHAQNGTQAEKKTLRLLAVAPGGAPCDFRAMPANNQGLAFWLGGTPREKGENYKAASPAAFVTKDACPMYFFHGDQDELVNLSSPKAMMEELKQAGVECDIHVISGAGHIAAAMNPEALAAALDFLDAHLKAQDTAEAAATSNSGGN